MLALVGAGMANIPWPTMLSVIAQISAREAQQPRRGTARILQQARAADRAVHGHCAVPGINLDSAFMSSVPGIFLGSRCLANTAASASLRSGTAGPARAIVP
jgi:hypothetical protein